MAWRRIIDTDSNGATPEPYTDTQGHTTTMTVVSSGGQASTRYFGANNGGLTNTWAVGDNSTYAAEFHNHTFSNPVYVLRVDLRYLDNGDAANFAYKTSPTGAITQINLNQWIANGDAVVTLGAGHSMQTGIPGNAALTVIRGSNTTSGAEGGTTTVDFYFPQPITNLYVGKNATTRTGASDSYGYRLYYDDVNSVICFGRGTLIETQHGEISVEELQAGDMVRTKDHGFQPIRWIGSRTLSATDLAASPNLQPIRINAGALGANRPSSDLTVSPQHRILIRSQIAQRMFGTDEVLVAAKHLLECDGIDIVGDESEVEYFHILFDRHQVIFSNGAESESLHTGAQALRSLSDAAREEIFAIFPELREMGTTQRHPPARPLVAGRVGRQLAARHNKNSRELVA